MSVLSGDDRSDPNRPVGENTRTPRRFGASAGNRLTQGLLSSSGRVAAIGLVTALLTLVFTSWFRFELAYQNEVGNPMARAASELAGSIDASLATLRAWVAYGDPSAVSERNRIWDERIVPQLAVLDALSHSADDPLAREKIAELGDDLRDLRRIQWVLEDVANSPGNNPAAVEYSRRLEPLRRSVQESLDGAIEQVRASRSDLASVDFMATLSQFRAAFTQGDLALGNLLTDFSAVHEYEVEERLRVAASLAEQIAVGARRTTSRDLFSLLEFSMSEFKAYSLQAPDVLEIARSTSRNVAHGLFAEQVEPLVARSRKLSAALAEAQARSTSEDANTLLRGSYVVIAMALLMGLLSAGSLLVSYRLRRQVENVMDRAKMLGQYVLAERIGKGGMGEVYLGHHAMLRRPTAIKLLRAENMQSLEAQQRFQDEVQLTSKLSHPNTVEIFDYGRTPEGIFYYAMEYLDGFTLAALVSRVGPVTPARVVHILAQACASLEEAHATGLLHRDIKPSNLMLTCRGGVADTLKILDFGLVKNVADAPDAASESSDEIAGTPMYLAPETILSADASTPQSDIYSLGAVAYFLLTGTTVFAAGELTEVLARQLDEEPDFPSVRLGRTLPEDLEYVIMACLAKNPEERPPDVATLAEMMRACEVGSWSQEDARLWWQEYGEATKAESTADEVRESVPSAVEILVDGTRA